jgi:hypothetical protein
MLDGSVERGSDLLSVLAYIGNWKNLSGENLNRGQPAYRRDSAHNGMKKGGE